MSASGLAPGPPSKPDQARMIEAISAWARIESPTDCPDGVNRMMDLVAAKVAGTPVGVERVPGREGLGDTLILRRTAQ